MELITGIGAAIGLASGFLGTQSENNKAKSAARKQNAYNKDMWEFNNEEAKRIFDYKNEGLEITKRNNEINLQYQEAMSIQSYNSAMSMRNYQETEKFNAWTSSISTATDQISFNDMAYKTAEMQQDRAYDEQLMGLMFDSKQTLQDFGYASMGIALKRNQERAAGVQNVQQERLAGMKAAAQVGAKGGSGRSKAKAIQGFMAESGARQAGIVEALMFNESGMDLNLTQLKDQLILDKAMLAATSDNMLFNDKAMRTKFLQARVQADMNAMANILTKPTALPPIPKPLVLPRPEYQALLEPRKPPKPKDAVAQTTNPWLGVASSLGSAAMAGAAAPGNTFDWASAFAAM